jgi:hypothetical protein
MLVEINGVLIVSGEAHGFPNVDNCSLYCYSREAVTKGMVLF